MTEETAVVEQTEAPAEKKKQVRPTLVKYPGLFDEAGNPLLLTEFPADYDPSKHSPFIRKDFADETIWLDWRATQYEKKAADYRQEIETIRRFGSPEDQKRAKQLLKFREKFEALKAQLSTGPNAIDVDAILAELGG